MIIATALLPSVGAENGAHTPAAAARAALAHDDFARVQDAPTQITEANSVDASAGTPAFCRVQGYVAPQVGFEIRLPIANWNGKLVAVGSGGYGGVI